MIKQWLRTELPKHRRSKLLQRLNRYCLGFHQAFENLNYDFHSNGENYVLQVLALQGGRPIILDVGANVGDWAAMASRICPQSHIHSFEIIPETRERLRQNTSACDNVSVHDFGLSDEAGEIEVYYEEGMNANATCVGGITEMFHKFTPARRTTAVVAGDVFCDDLGIDVIDFLKMDVEGFEPQVLRGLAKRLSSGGIKSIQFEYGYVNAVTKFLLKDFYDLLSAHDMVVGKIYPNYVDFKEYDLRDENFFGPNYFAVHKSMTALIKAVGGH